MSSFHERKEVARIKLETVRDEYGVELPTFSWEISAQRVDWPNASYVTVDAAAAKLDPQAKDDSESVFATDAVLKVMRDEVDALKSKREEYNLDGQGLERIHDYVEGLAEKANSSIGDAAPLEEFTVDGREMTAYVLDHSFLGSTLNSDPTGGSFWSCALVLCKVLEYRKDTLKGLRVCELGAGLGLCGIAAWMLGCSEAVLTDKEPMVVENLRLNSTIAFLDSGKAEGWDGCSDSCPLVVETFAYGDDPSLLSGPFDIILCADLLYASVGQEAMALLAQTCSKLADANGEVITANAVREGGAQAAAFGDLMASNCMVGEMLEVPGGVCPENVVNEVQVISWRHTS